MLLNKDMALDATRGNVESPRLITPLIRAVMAAEFRNGATGKGLAEGLRSSGWLIEEIDHNRFLRGNGGKSVKAVHRLFRSSLCRSFNETILEACEALDAEVLISIKGSDLHHTTLLSLRDRNVRSILYYPDVDFNHPGVNVSVIKDVDILITTKSFQMDWLREFRDPRPTCFVHHGYFTVAEHPLIFAEDEYGYDITYVGHPDRYKLAYLVAVAKAFPNRKILVAGNRWGAASAGTELEPFVLDHPLSGDFLADIHRRSRLNIAVHMGRQASGWQDLVSTRTFEIPAFGGFMLHVDNPEVRGLYDVPGEIDVFEGADDLIEKIAYYLDRPALRRQMIDRAHRRAVPAYSYHSRGMEIDSLLRPLIG